MATNHVYGPLLMKYDENLWTITTYYVWPWLVLYADHEQCNMTIDDGPRHRLMDADCRLRRWITTYDHGWWSQTTNNGHFVLQQVIRHGRWLVFIDHDDIKRMTTPHHGSRYLTMYIGNRSKARSRAKTFGDWVLKLHGFLTQRPPGSCPLERTCGPNDLLPTLQGNSNGYVQFKSTLDQDYI